MSPASLLSAACPAAPRRRGAAAAATAAVAWLVAVAVLAGVPAGAHEEVPGVRTVLDAVVPEIDGISVAVRRSVADELAIENRTDVPVEVIGDDGEPFLRIGPGGVEADLASPDLHRSADPSGDAPVPDGVQAGDPPRWVRVSSEPAWSWFDHRMHRVTLVDAPDEGVIERWVVPLRHGDQAIEVRGRREFSRPRGAISPVLTGVPDGLEVTVLPGRVPGLFLRLAGAEEAVVIGQRGEPMARVTPERTEVNDASPTWSRIEGASPDGGTAADTAPAADAPVGAEEPPRWRELPGSAGRLTWLEPRATSPVEEPTPDRIARPAALVAWSVPVRLDGADQPELITGETRWVPGPDATAGDGGGARRTALLVALGGGVLAVATGIAVAISRRGGRPAGRARG